MCEAALMLWTLLTNQGHAEDVLLRYRYCYYVLGEPVVSDQEYDELEQYVRSQWSVGAAWQVGSDQAGDYPLWVREGRRPGAEERVIRDAAIVQRWVEGI